MATAVQDCAVLFQAFTSLNAPTAGGDCCGVTGISCENGRVVRIALASSNLEGVLPDFSKLTELIYLRLEINFLSGRIPTSIGALTKLTIIDIGSNGLTGEIPSSISQMSALQELYIGFNRLTGEIPSGLSSMASHLRVINMAGNRLIGSLPTSYGALTLLTELEIQDNLLIGFIPSEYGSFTRMTDLRLSGNQLTGPIPDELLGLPTAGVLYFQENNFSGPLSPAWTARKNFNGTSNCFDGQTGSNRNPTCDTLSATKTSSSIPSQTAGSIVPSTKPSSPANGGSASTDSTSSNGGLIGGVVGGVLALLLLAGLAYWWFKRSNNSEKKAEISSRANPSSSNANPPNSNRTNNTRDIESEQIEIFSAHESASNPDTTTSGAISSNINSTDFLTSNAARLEEQASNKEKKSSTAPGLLDVFSSSGAATGGSLASANSFMDLKQLKKGSETTHASQWTTEDVCVWAARVLPGIGKTVAVKVMEHGVDGTMLFKLTNEHLRDDLGLVKLQDRMAFLDALERLKGGVDEVVAVGPTGPPVYTP
ncbi:hypothetical protein BJ741DRAFT_427567 [Chytriomyces cf. hyalinus JEL632]|nr:hypothetical protein BJ741DRAFT_427567 [Chytriomyces cf. hyalinus JEL632]